MTPPHTEHEHLIIGLGNLLKKDEGVGVRIAQKLKNTLKNVDVLDSGSSGFLALHAMANRKKVVFVDCAFMDLPPGSIRRFTPEDVVNKKIQPRLSLHEGDLFQIIELSKKLGECPNEVVIFGIEPENIDMGENLTESLNINMGKYVNLIRSEYA